MAVILSIETSTSVCSVAIHRNGKLLVTTEVHIEQSHASKLALIVDQSIKTAGITKKELDAVAVTSGPGSYTGLRIGTSTAKGMCYGLDIPLIAVGTLELLAYEANQFNTDQSLLCPMIDARRMEVFCLLSDSALNIIEPTQALVVEENAFEKHLDAHKILFFGDGAQKCSTVIKHGNAFFLDSLYPKASILGQIAQVKFLQKEFEDLVHFEPFYLKEFQAKIAVNNILL